MFDSMLLSPSTTLWIWWCPYRISMMAGGASTKESSVSRTPSFRIWVSFAASYKHLPLPLSVSAFWRLIVLNPLLLLMKSYKAS